MNIIEMTLFNIFLSFKDLYLFRITFLPFDIFLNILVKIQKEKEKIEERLITNKNYNDRKIDN